MEIGKGDLNVIVLGNRWRMGFHDLIVLRRNAAILLLMSGDLMNQMIDEAQLNIY